MPDPCNSAPAKTVYIGIGSNLDLPVRQVIDGWLAIHALPKTDCHNLSGLFVSMAVGPGSQPDYINAAASLTTQLSPIELLDALQAIEHRQKRVREQQWGPRTLDLDILLIDDTVIDHSRLQVPHPRLQERNFVLAPLLDLNPALALPDRTSVQTLLARCGNQGLSRYRG